MIKGEWLWKAGPWDKKQECIVTIDEVKKWPADKQERFMALAYQVRVYN
jgi:hypothetical protein